MSWTRTLFFWNNNKNIEYFANKPSDPRVKKRLEQLVLQRRGADEFSALDLGCGGGRHTELLVGLGFMTSVVDLNWRMLHATVKRIGRSKLVSVKQASITKLPYKDASFDAIVTTGVLHQTKNFQEYQVAVSELSRTLKSGGLICLNIFTSLSLDDSYTKLSDAFAYRTKEGLDMTLLSKSTFYELMDWYDLNLEEELSEDIVEENTGMRSVLRCSFIKSI